LPANIGLRLGLLLGAHLHKAEALDGAEPRSIGVTLADSTVTAAQTLSQRLFGGVVDKDPTNTYYFALSHQSFRGINVRTPVNIDGSELRPTA